MCKKTFLLLALLPLCVFAQTPDWLNADYRSMKYSSDKYFTGYSIRAIQKGEDVSQALDKVKDAARVQAVQSIKVHVENVTRDDRFSKSVEDLRSFDETIIETFSTQTRLTTDLEITNLHLETCRNNDNEVVGFAYVKRSDVIRQFDKSITSKLSKLEIQMDNVDEMVANGQKIEARTKLQPLYAAFADIEADQKVLLAIDEDADLESIQMPQLKALIQRYNKTMAQLKNGLTIFIDCQADLFGDNYPTLADALKGELSKLGCSFVTSAAEADWAIYVMAKAREYNAPTMGGYTTYFAYIDATLAIDKVATNQRIYEDALSKKGGHTLNYSEAAIVAYNELVLKIVKTLKTFNL